MGMSDSDMENMLNNPNFLQQMNEMMNNDAFVHMTPGCKLPPEGEDENEWLAVNMVDFYNQINLLYGAITEFCSPQSCPEMKATDE